MATTFNLGDYECLKFPATAWRVTHPGSQAQLDPVTGDLVAADTEREFSCEWHLKSAANSHFNPKSRNPSCFVSVFLNGHRAKAWAKGRGDPDDVFITEIDMGAVPLSSYIFDACQLAERLDTFWCPLEYELLFLHRVPRRCLGGRRSLGQIYDAETFRLACTPRRLRLVTFHAPAELDETTNPTTQRKSPAMRYFKSPMNFTLKYVPNLGGRLLWVTDVRIAHHEDREGRYGQEYVYAVFPDELRESLFRTRCQRSQTNIDDEELAFQIGPGDWWKRVYVHNCVFEDTRSDDAPAQTPASFNLCSTLSETRKGISADFWLGISLKAKTGNRASLLDSTPWTVEIEAYKGCVTDIGVDVGPIPFVGRVVTIVRACDVLASPELIRKSRDLVDRGGNGGKLSGIALQRLRIGSGSVP